MSQKHTIGYFFNDELLKDDVMSVTPIKRLPLLTRVLIGILCFCEVYNCNFDELLKDAHKHFEKL